MSSSSFAIPQVIAGPIQTGISMCKKAYTKAQEVYGTCQGRVVKQCEARFSPKVAETVKKITDAVPEIIFCSAMFTGAGKTVAEFLWAAKLVQLLYPIALTAVTIGVDQESMRGAFNESHELFTKSLDNFAPAIAFTCGVGAVAAGISGIFGSAVLLMKASFFGVLSHLAYQNMQKNTATSAAKSA